MMPNQIMKEVDDIKERLGNIETLLVKLVEALKQ